MSDERRAKRDLKDLLKVAVAAELIDVPENTLRHWMSRRMITYVKLGASTRIWLDDLQAFVEAGTVPGVTRRPKPIGENLINLAEDAENVGIKKQLLSEGRQVQ